MRGLVSEAQGITFTQLPNTSEVMLMRLTERNREHDALWCRGSTFSGD